MSPYKCSKVELIYSACVNFIPVMGTTWMVPASGTNIYSSGAGGGGGGSDFPYILLNGIETMFSELAKQSHWILSADCCIAHEHIRPVDLPVNTFSNGN